MREREGVNIQQKNLTTAWVAGNRCRTWMQSRFLKNQMEDSLWKRGIGLSDSVVWAARASLIELGLACVMRQPNIVHNVKKETSDICTKWTQKAKYVTSV